jgi:hypothetical protein
MKTDEQVLDPSIITREWWNTMNNEERLDAYKIRLKRWLRNAPPEGIVATNSTAENPVANNISQLLRRKK